MRSYFGSAAMVGTVLVAALGCYMVSLKVSSERAAVEALRTHIAADARDIRMLQAELRTRSRLPELQRWNDNVLALAPPVERQFVHDAVQLASYAPGTTPPTAAPRAGIAPRSAPRFAILPAAVPARPMLQQVAYAVPARAPVPAVVPAPAAKPHLAAPPAAEQQARAAAHGINADLGAAVAAAAAAEAAPAAVAPAGKAAMQ